MRRLLLLGALLCAAGCGKPGRLVDYRDGSTPALGLRVVQRWDEGFAWFHDFYFVECRRPTETEWRKVATVWTEDRSPIRSDAITVLNDRVAFVVLHPLFVVTTDGGETWDTWDACGDGPTWNFCSHWMVDRAELRPDGGGSLFIHSMDSLDGGMVLTTTDFGRSWGPAPPTTPPCSWTPPPP